MKDILGREIKVGDLIAWGVRDGNTGKLSVGIVKEIQDPGEAKKELEEEYDGELPSWKEREFNDDFMHGLAEGNGGWVKANRFETEWYHNNEEGKLKLGRLTKLVCIDRIVVVERNLPV